MAINVPSSLPLLLTPSSIIAVDGPDEDVFESFTSRNGAFWLRDKICFQKMFPIAASSRLVILCLVNKSCYKADRGASC